jgi:hypothetical protein
MPGLLALLLLTAGILLLASTAAAPSWGPGTHIHLTLELCRRLKKKKKLRAPQSLILEHFQPFLYGNIAADVINFKAYGGVKNHCHNWNIHERLEAHATDDAARAFILGYLCHLAADIVAHNHFVPYHLVHALPPRILGHAYWEAKADNGVSDVEWHSIDKLKRNKSIHAYDRLIHLAVKRKALGLRSNKWIFNNILLISCRQRWRTFVRGIESREVRHPLDEPFHIRCRVMSLRNMMSVFYTRRFALLKAHDPTGREALRGALRLRRELVRDFGTRTKAREVAMALAHSAYGLK